MQKLRCFRGDPTNLSRYRKALRGKPSLIAADCLLADGRDLPEPGPFGLVEVDPAYGLGALAGERAALREYVRALRELAAAVEAEARRLEAQLSALDSAGIPTLWAQRGQTNQAE